MKKNKRDPNLPPLSLDGLAIYRRLLGYARPHLGVFSVGVLGMAMFAAVDTGFAWLVKEFLDGAFVERDPSVLSLVPAGILVLFLVRGVGDYLAVYAPGGVGRQVIKRLRGEIFSAYLNLPASYYDAHGVAPLLSRLTYNVELVSEAATNAVTTMIRDTLTIVGLLSWLLYMNWRLSLFALAVAPFIVGLIRITSRLFRRYSHRIQASMGDVTRVAKEALEGQRMVKVFNAQAREARMFEAVNEHNRHSHMRLVTVKAVSNPVVQMIAALGLAAVLYAAIRQVLAGQLSIGEFSSFLAALLLLTAPLRRLVSVVGPLQQGIAAGQSVFEILDAPSEPAGGGRRLERAEGRVEFLDVSFRYAEGQEGALEGVNFQASPGQVVAIVGRSGSGKSTLVGMLPRFYDVTAGEVRLDGLDVREYALADLRAQVSLVSQDVALVDDSIRNNIAYSAPAATPDQVERAARMAHVLEFSNALPQGLDTRVGERGSLLSGGQRQRVAIARALLKDAPVLILDEATSALDSESERAIQSALDDLVRDRTTLVIAHRLSTIERADLILVMDEGRVVERGTHAQLLQQGGVYAALHRMQFSV
ncbi:MAG: lipid A export permease/ATP-binding protein MsbA [Steroidobacteraceae bacterium]